MRPWLYRSIEFFWRERNRAFTTADSRPPGDPGVDGSYLATGTLLPQLSALLADWHVPRPLAVVPFVLWCAGLIWEVLAGVRKALCSRRKAAKA